MGGGHFDGDVAVRTRSSSSSAVARGGHIVDSARASRPRSQEKECDPKLNPFKAIRECRDNADHPHTTPLAVLFDVTRSPWKNVVAMYRKLPMYIGQLYLQDIVPHPTISFCAFGDATFGDKAPLQVGQFEADNRLDEILGNIWLEGGGGGTGQESAELAAYFYDRHTELDAWRRNEKGHLFIGTDEGFYPQVSAGQVKRLIGDNLPADIPTVDIFRELATKYHIWVILPRQSWEERKDDIDEEIKQRVERAGGQYGDVDVRFSLIWHNRNDLDLHVITPKGFEIYYAQKHAPCGGYLDVDMNVSGETNKPVENVRWKKGQAPRGTYKVYVQNYAYHEGSQAATPFKVEIEVGGKVEHFEGSIPAHRSGSSSDIPVGEFFFDPAANQEQTSQADLYAGYDDAVVKAQWTAVVPDENIIHIQDPNATVDAMLGILSVSTKKRTLPEYLKDMADREQTPERIADIQEALKNLAHDVNLSQVEIAAPAEAPRGAKRRGGSKRLS